MSLRTLEFTLPSPGPAGAHIAFDAMLRAYGYAPYEVSIKGQKMTFRVKCEPWADQNLADHAMTVFPVNHVEFLDVDSGVHFALDRQHRMRSTGDDR